MRLITTLFIFILFSTMSFAQEYAKRINQQANIWLEKNEYASKAIYFSADVLSDAVELFWEVEQEEAIAGYELQRSINGGDFRKIIWFDSAGLEEEGGTYLHLDETPSHKDVIQYRIKAIRKDGQYVYSSTQIVDLQLSRPVLDFSSSDDVRPAFIALDDNGLDVSKQIELLDATGKTLLRLSPSKGQFRMDLSRLEKGVYYIKMVLADGEDKIERIVKQG